jgi:hypothetical protein
MVGENDKTSIEEKSTSIKFIRENLSDLISYKFESADQNSVLNSPFYNVYSLLDDIGKKLDWPSWQKLSSNNSAQTMKIEDKINLLFNLKKKISMNDPATLKLQIPLSALNKQISFYGIAYFFHKLSEVYSLNRATNASLLTERLVLVSDRFSYEIKESSFGNGEILPIQETLINSGVSNLIICLKMWEKFNQHKEISTIIIKCLSNSKLDCLPHYKSFLSDFYTNSYALAMSNQSNQTAQNLANLNPKQKISLMAYLFMNEKKSIEVGKFFFVFNLI